MISIINNLSDLKFFLVYGVYCITILIIANILLTKTNRQCYHEDLKCPDLNAMEVLSLRLLLNCSENSVNKELLKVKIFKLWAENLIRINNNEITLTGLQNTKQLDDVEIYILTKAQNGTNYFSLIEDSNMSRILNTEKQKNINSLNNYKLLKDEYSYKKMRRVYLFFLSLFMFPGVTKMLLNFSNHKSMHYIAIGCVIYYVAFLFVNGVSKINKNGDLIIKKAQEQYPFNETRAINNFDQMLCLYSLDKFRHCSAFKNFFMNFTSEESEESEDDD